MSHFLVNPFTPILQPRFHSSQVGFNRQTASGESSARGGNVYIPATADELSTQMIHSLHRHSLFALYQLTVALGILMMPIALVARRAGVRLPFGRIVDALGEAYEQAETR